MSDTPAVQQVRNDALALRDEVGAIVIDSPQRADMAADKIRDIKRLRKAVEDAFDPIVKAANETVKRARGERDRHLEPLDDAERTIKTKLSTWHAAQEALAREAQRVAEEEARRIAEDEALAAAQELQRQGHTEAAEQVLSAPIVAVPVVVTRPPKPSGVSFIKHYKAVITDPDLVPREYCCPDEKKINKLVAALGPAARIPGVLVTETTTTAVRS